MVFRLYFVCIFICLIYVTGSMFCNQMQCLSHSVYACVRQCPLSVFCEFGLWDSKAGDSELLEGGSLEKTKVYGGKNIPGRRDNL